MKKCDLCRVEKRHTEFNRNKAKPDGLNGICRDCGKVRSKKYYAANTAKHKRAISERKQRQVADSKAFVVDYLSTHPCIDCGEQDIVVLEFDHVIGSKRDSVSRMIASGCSLDSIKQEIEKCVVRCSNDHRRRTSRLFGSYRLGSIA
jgi:hypothetical protein